MGAPKEPDRVNLICAVLAVRPEWLDAAEVRLAGEFGPVDLRSDVWPFDATDYYAAEMGTPLLRRMFGFERLVDPGELAAIKRRTNALEAALSRELADAPPRPVNLDPGYVTLSKLVLATTKNYSHRIYIGQGIYAESTLHYENGRWTAWPWTYPDYADMRYHKFFMKVREKYKQKLSELIEISRCQQCLLELLLFLF